jgi:hypothetical protein
MFRTADDFYLVNRLATLCVSAVAFAVWAIVLTFIAVI